MSERRRAPEDVATWRARATRALLDAPLADAAPRLEAELLLVSVIDAAGDRAWLYAHADHRIAPAELARLDAALARRVAGEPLAYLTGWREFHAHRFEIAPGVLVPRPETELLVELAIEWLDARRVAGSPEPRCVDAGTGSGAIAISVASARPHGSWLASDASADALAVAVRNVARLASGRVALLRADWLEPFADGSLDLVVSNPPYIDAADPHLAALAHEPLAALVADDGGLADLASIARDAARALAADGVLMLEHGYGQGATVRALMRDAGFADVRTHRDLAGHERVTAGSLPPAR